MNKGDCSLYVDIRVKADNLRSLIQEEYEGTKEDSYYVDCDWAFFEVERNDAYSWIRKRRKDDGFLFYRYVIYVESKMPEEAFSDYITKLHHFITVLKEKGAKVVPACDFEDELKK